MNAQAYLRTDAYRDMLDRIIAAPADPGLCLRSTLIEILGAAGLWPDYCREDDEREQRRERDLTD